MSPSSTQPRPSHPLSSRATDEAIKIVCAIHIHQCLWLPANESHGKLRVTFATTTNFSDTTLPVILFCPPMFGGRWLSGLHLNHLAEQTGVRIICADRPGMGGSTKVPLNIRVQVWLETLPILLQHLGISRVSIVAHSAGTMYALNTLYHFREILDPETPYLALLAPWVENAYSRTPLMNVASKLPSGVVDGLAGVNKFINQRIMPVASWSGGVFSSAAEFLQSGSGAGSDSDGGATTPAERYGVEDEVGKEVERLATKFYFEEDVTAGNEEAKLCLKKDGTGFWGQCEDYAEFAKLIKSREKQRLDSHSPTDSKVSKLLLDAYFAESDVMIGKEGQKYFDACWQQDDANDNPVCFETTELSGTNHDSILLDYKNGALKRIFERVRELHQ